MKILTILICALCSFSMAGTHVDHYNVADIYNGDFPLATLTDSEAQLKLQRLSIEGEMVRETLPGRPEMADEVHELGGSMKAGLNLNTWYSDTITSVGQQRAFAYTVTGSGIKLTAVLASEPTNANFNLHLFRLDANGNILDYQYSLYLSQYTNVLDDTVSMDAPAGDYMLIINSEVGTGSYVFGLLASTGADANEPNDNIWQSPTPEAYPHMNGSLDNFLDYDVTAFDVPTAVTATPVFNCAGLPNNSDYKMALHNANGVTLIEYDANNINQNITIQPGTYYLRVYAAGGTAYTLPYTAALEGIPVSVDNLYVRVDEYPHDQKINYGDGLMYRAEEWIEVSGNMVDSLGRRIPNQAVYLSYTTSSASSNFVSGTTDSSGYFNLHLNLPWGIGEDVFSSSRYCHYYDIRPYVLHYGPDSSNVQAFHDECIYYIAYQVYRGSGGTCNPPSFTPSGPCN